MKILIVNKFLYPNGGSETYIFKLGEFFGSHGHEVQFFGMEHAGRTVGNHAESYTSDLDFHTGKLKKLLYPFKILYSVEARKKIRKVLEDFTPDVVHLNNFNFQLTPSIIYEVRAFEKKCGKKIKIVYTAHDGQLVCPNHLMRIPSTGELCMRCTDGNYFSCTRNRCIHGSRLKSLLGSLEAYLYKSLHAYCKLDVIICPSRFLKNQLDKYGDLSSKTKVLHNFCGQTEAVFEKEEYVVYFGRYSEEKGMGILLEICTELEDIPFVFAGDGPLKEEVGKVGNITNVGFQTGDKLKEIVGKAQFSIFPSQCYENCPFSVMEAQIYGTPVIASGIGGVGELLSDGETGLLCTPEDKEEWKRKILSLWNHRDKLEKMQKNCRKVRFDTVEEYCNKLMEIYES